MSSRPIFSTIPTGLLTSALLAFVFLATALSAAPNTTSDETAYTYFKDAKPILRTNCETCHRPEGQNQGGVSAPMSLQTYDEVRPWAKAIARAVESRAMPPWFATAHTKGQFHGERVLDETQIEILLAWVRSGAKAGDPNDSPAVQPFAEESTDGWTLGKPDLVVTFDEPYFVDDDIEDLNISFETTLSEDQFPQDRWFRGAEFRVGGRNVHHMCASAYAPGETRTFSVKGAFARNGIGCIALGAEPTLLPEGFAQLLQKGSKISFSMHYNKEAGPGTGFSDQSEIAFYFTDAPPKHKAVYDAVGNTSFEIPPQARRWRVGAAKTFEQDSYLIAMWPHAHLRAVATKYELFYPDGRSELLLDVPEYDQEWQTTYRYKELKLLPAGSRLEVSMWYENSPERGAERGFDPDRAIVFGPETRDEMMLGFINWAPVAEHQTMPPSSSAAHLD